MFTGLIEAVGEVAELTPAGGGLRLRVATPLARELALGESVAVNGVCLTVAASDRGEWQADVSPETARVTSLGSLVPGRLVNLERSLKADGRLGGHFVQGHVDAPGVIEEIRPAGDFLWLTVRYPRDIASHLVPKGSIAVDGISLTIAGLREDRFDVQIVPFTWDHTNLRGAERGHVVNLETDLIGKYIVRLMELRQP